GDGDGGVAGRGGKQRAVWFAVQRPEEPFLLPAEGGRAGGQKPSDAGGASAAGVGDSDDCGLLAGSAGAVGAQFRQVAESVAAGVAAGGGWQPGGGEPVIAETIHRGMQRQILGEGAGTRDGDRSVCRQRPGAGVFDPNRAGGGQGQHGGDRGTLVADR